jgi:hypothetical protein
LICWNRYSDAPKPPTTRTFCGYKVSDRYSCDEARQLETHLQESVLCLNGNDLIPDQLQDSVHDRLEALQNLFVCEGHVALLDSGVGELSLNAHVHGPLLTVIPEVGLDSVLKVHDALGVHLTGSL